MPNSTIVIPIKIDSDIRLKNINLTVKYLLKNTDSYIHLYEADEIQKFNFKEFDNSRIKYEYHHSDTNEFHRTKIINEMLSASTTPITVNYDADVLLPVSAYTSAEQLLLNGEADVVYPYGFEKYDQRKIFIHNDLNKDFLNNFNLELINPHCTQIGFCRFGHVQFFNTKVYKNGFMENENYKHWCPEDEERGIRFVKLGYKVIWLNSLIYHQEHPPSTLTKPVNINEIVQLHNSLVRMSKEELINYYQKQEYLKKYEYKH